VLDFVVYLVIRLLICLVQIVSYERARRLAGLLGRLAFRLDRKHRARAEENLINAYGDTLTARQREDLVRQVYVHFCTLVVEMVHLTRRTHPTNWKKFAELVGAERTVTALISGRPLLVVTGHFGNWEVAGLILGLLGFRTHAIARTIDNPYLDRFARQFRQRTGQRILAKKGDFDGIQDVLAEGGILATLADQDAGQRGVFVDFFGRPASTHKAVSLLALQYDVPLLVVGAPKVEGVRAGSPARHHVISADLIDPREYEGRPDAVQAMTQRYTSALEGLIRLAPEQYFWLHRRWKSQPPPKKVRGNPRPRFRSDSDETRRTQSEPVSTYERENEAVY
jgi:KDO2-lipid IV(A) lauroyltransferase